MNATGRPRARSPRGRGGSPPRGRPLRQGERLGTTPQLPRSRRVEPRSPQAPACTPSTERAPALRAGLVRFRLSERGQAAALGEQGVGALGDVPELAPALGCLRVKGFGL